MSLTADDINAMLGDYIKSPEGKKYIEDSKLNVSGYSESDMTGIASKLKKSLVNAYFGQLRESRKYFDLDSINVGIPRQLTDGTWKLTITFAGKGLFRRSLSTASPQSKYVQSNKTRNKASGWTQSFTGKGVDDIWALFTQGYWTKQVYGFWWDSQGDSSERGEFGSIKSRSVRSPNSFIANTIKIFEAQYPDLKIEFPIEWGGTL